MTEIQPDASPQSQAVSEIKTLFAKLQQCESEGSLSMAEPREIERQVARLAAQVAALAPNSVEHADALAYHKYTLLVLARMSKLPSVVKSLRKTAYELGEAEVTIRLQIQNQEMGTVNAAYNLAIDLIVRQKESQRGLDWMLKGRALLTKLAGKKALPKDVLYFKLYYIDYGLAKAYYDLGQHDVAKRILKQSLHLAPALNTASWTTLRGVAQCSQLLARIHLDCLQAERNLKTV